MFNIDKQIPIPPDYAILGKKRKYPFEIMEVWDSVLLPVTHAFLGSMLKRMAPKEFCSQKQPSGLYRIWRCDGKRPKAPIESPFIIEKGVPLPEYTRHKTKQYRSKYDIDWESLKVWEAFFVAGVDRLRLSKRAPHKSFVFEESQMHGVKWVSIYRYK